MSSPKNSRQADIIRLRHMLDASKQVLTFTNGRDRSDLETDQMLALAVVRLIEIIGEAAKNVSPEVQALSTRYSLETNQGDSRQGGSCLLRR